MKTILLFVTSIFFFSNSQFAFSQEWLYNNSNSNPNQKTTHNNSTNQQDNFNHNSFGNNSRHQVSYCQCNCNCQSCNNYNNYFQPLAISDYNFSQLTSFISKRPFSDSRVSIMKEAIDFNWFKVNQIKDLFSYLSFESDKIEIAKYSYKKIIDKQNFYHLYDLLSFESSVDELMEFVRNQRQ